MSALETLTPGTVVAFLEKVYARRGRDETVLVAARLHDIGHFRGERGTHPIDAHCGVGGKGRNDR